MKKVKKLVFFFLCLALVLSGCVGKDTSKTVVDNNADLSKYPIETDVTLSYFRAMPSNISTLVENYGETEYAKEFEKRVGVKIEYLHPGANALHTSAYISYSPAPIPKRRKAFVLPDDKGERCSYYLPAKYEL